MGDVLFIRDGALGDVILTTGIIREYSKQNNCKVDVSTKYSDVFKNNPYVNKTISSPNLSKYSKIINLNDVHEKNSGTHMLVSYSDFVFQRNDLDLHPELFATENDNVSINFPYIVMHLRKNHGESRNLPEDFYKNIIKGVLEHTQNLYIVIIGSGFDFQIKGHEKILNYVGKYNLHQSYNVIKNAKAFIGVDSAPYHIASCTNTPMIGFFTETKGEYREPKNRNGKHITIASNIDCYGCLEKYLVPGKPYHCNRGDYECKNRFDANQVIEQLLSLL